MKNQRTRTSKRTLSVVTTAAIAGSTLLSPISALANEVEEVKQPVVYETIEQAIEDVSAEVTAYVSVVEEVTVEENANHKEEVEAPAEVSDVEKLVETIEVEVTEDVVTIEETVEFPKVETIAEVEDKELNREQRGFLGAVSEVFPDANLANSIASHLGINASSPVFEQDLASIQVLSIRGDITTFEGFQYLSNLRNLDIRRGQMDGIIEQVSSLLPNPHEMEVLWLEDTGITDINFMSNMPNLTFLWLEGNQISDISVLSNMPNLSFLNLNNNRVSDLRPLQSLTRLSTFEARNQFIELEETAIGVPVSLNVFNIDGTTTDLRIWNGTGIIESNQVTWWGESINDIVWSGSDNFTGTIRQSSMGSVDEVELVRATVARIIDGDTIEVNLPSGAIERVRFIGVDAPERGEDFFDEATEYTRNLLEGRIVYIEREGNNRDPHGRLRRHVWLAEPSTDEANIRENLVGARLISAGLAEPLANFTPRHSELFERLMNEAQESHLGMWNTVGPMVGSSLSHYFLFEFELGTSQEEMLEYIKPHVVGIDARGNRVVIDEIKFVTMGFDKNWHTNIGYFESIGLSIRCSQGAEHVNSNIRIAIVGEYGEIPTPEVDYMEIVPPVADEENGVVPPTVEDENELPGFNPPDYVEADENELPGFNPPNYVEADENELPGFNPPNYIEADENELPGFNPPNYVEADENELPGFNPPNYVEADENELPGFNPPNYVEADENELPGFNPPNYVEADENELPGFNPPNYVEADELPGFNPPNYIEADELPEFNNTPDYIQPDEDELPGFNPPNYVEADELPEFDNTPDYVQPDEDELPGFNPPNYVEADENELPGFNPPNYVEADENELPGFNPPNYVEADEDELPGFNPPNYVEADEDELPGFNPPNYVEADEDELPEFNPPNYVEADELPEFDNTPDYVQPDEDTDNNVDEDIEEEEEVETDENTDNNVDEDIEEEEEVETDEDTDNNVDEDIEEGEEAEIDEDTPAVDSDSDEDAEENNDNVVEEDKEDDVEEEVGEDTLPQTSEAAAMTGLGAVLASIGALLFKRKKK